MWLTRESLKIKGTLPLTQVGYKQTDGDQQEDQVQLLSKPLGVNHENIIEREQQMVYIISHKSTRPHGILIGRIKH